MSICCSVLRFKAQLQLSDFQTPSHMSTAQDKNLPFQPKANARPKRGNREGCLGTPEICSSGNVAFDDFTGEVVRNTGSSLSETSPRGNKCTVRSYLPESTEEAPKHELIKGTRYFKLQIPK